MSTPDRGKLDLSDGSSDVEELFASPSRTSKQSKPADRENVGAAHSRSGASRYDTEHNRDALLQNELEGVRGINEVIEGVVASLECAKANMETVSRTVTSASTLLNTWIRILSQTEHNQRLLLNTDWQGASQDLANIENEAILRMQAAERKAAEDERIKEEAKRHAEDEERQQRAGTTRGATRGTRGRARSVGRAGSVSSSGYGLSRTSSVSGGRGISQPSVGRSGIGRGTSSVRGRGRGNR